jgi:hypothetical protein
MTQVTYGQYSTYYQTPQISNYVSYLDFWKGQYILPQSTDSLYLIEQTYQHRPDLVSYQLYGNSQLWWVFALRNPNSIKDPIWDFVSGLTIYVPSRDSLIKVS